MPSMFRSRWTASASPLRTVRGRSTWVMSPVTMIFAPWPIRVRNIFICGTVVFCPSSRMMQAFESVRPRMYASGRISMMSFSMYRRTCSGSMMSLSASKSGRRYGLIFATRSPGR